MSFNFQHLSRAGARILKQMENPPPGIRRKRLKDIRRTSPPFLQSDLPVVPQERRYKTLKDWEYLPGDRVVITKPGEFYGHICKVRSHNVECNGYELDENGPTRVVVIPKMFWQEGQTTHVMKVPQTLRREDLKLVVDIDDPLKPNHLKTVMVQNVVISGSYYDKQFKKYMPYRYVHGNKDSIIPWPQPAAKEEGDLSTPPNVTREQTYWIDSMVENPVPKKAIYTLRNVHSKYHRGKITLQDLKKLVAPKMIEPIPDEKLMALKRPARPQFTDADRELINKTMQEFMDKQKLENGSDKQQ